MPNDTKKFSGHLLQGLGYGIDPETGGFQRRQSNNRAFVYVDRHDLPNALNLDLSASNPNLVGRAVSQHYFVSSCSNDA